MSRTLLIWRHPQQTVKLLVPSSSEGMRTVEINRLACQQMHRLAVFLSDLVVWEMGMKIESWDVFVRAELVNVAGGRVRCDLLCDFGVSCSGALAIWCSCF